MAAAILGGHYAGHPISTRSALARSRSVFWRVVGVSLIVAIPVYAAQYAISTGLEGLLGKETDISIVASTLAAALVGSPLAYLLTGVVLGDVGAVRGDAPIDPRLPGAQGWRRPSSPSSRPWPSC